MHFPEGYFDEKTEAVPQEVIDLISIPFAQMLFSRIPDKHMEDVPHGGDGGAVMAVSLSGSRFIYKSVHASEDGYSFVVDPVAEEFVRIIQLLKPYCSFPKFSPMETKVVIPREIPAAIRQKAFIETGKGERIIGYHCEATGAAFHCFYKNGKDICDVSWISGPSDKSVMINGKDFKWISGFEPSTLSPGLDKTECLIFLNTPNSLLIDNVIDGSATASPWIYSELTFSRLCRKRKLSEYRRHLAHDSLHEFAQLNVKYDVSLSHLVELNDGDLLQIWMKSRQKRPQEALDDLYTNLGLLPHGGA